MWLVAIMNRADVAALNTIFALRLSKARRTVGRTDSRLDGWSVTNDWLGKSDCQAVCFARSIDRSLARSLARSLDRSLARSLARSLDRSLARSLARSIDRSLDRSLACSIARSLARPLRRGCELFRASRARSAKLVTLDLSM